MIATTTTRPIARTISHVVSRSTPRRLSSVLSAAFSAAAAIRSSGADTQAGTRLVVEARAVVAALQLRRARAREEGGEPRVRVDLRLGVRGHVHLDDAVSSGPAAGCGEQKNEREATAHDGIDGIEARAVSHLLATSFTGSSLLTGITSSQARRPFDSTVFWKRTSSTIGPP